MKSQMIYDLHCHSNVSDGVLFPAEVVRRAAEKGVHVLALTDHDALSGLPDAGVAAQAVGLQLIAGVEISAKWEQHAVHVVGLGIDADHLVLSQGLAAVRRGRIERAQRIGDALAQAGIPDAFEGASGHAANPEIIGRAHFGRFLVAQGYAPDLSTVFKRFLVPGKPGYVEHTWVPLAQSVAWIHAAGGLAVLAHPGRYGLRTARLRGLFTAFKACGGNGVEVAVSSHTPDQVAQFARLSNAFGLLASVGSDFHGVGHYAELGVIPPLPSHCNPIWRALCGPVH